MQRLELSFIDGNFWQLKDLRGDGNSGLHKGVVSSEMLSVSSANVHVKNDSGKLVRDIPSAVSDLVPGSFLNETIPWRQRGQGIEPGGPWAALEAVLVEQRYNAQRVQNS